MSFQLKMASCLTGEENVCELDGERESEVAGKWLYEERGTGIISGSSNGPPGSFGDKALQS